VRKLRKNKIILFFGIVMTLLVVTFLVSGCSGFSVNYSQSANGGQKASVQVNPSNDVTIQGSAFSPSNLTVKVGDTVKWTNNDKIDHTVTSDTGVFNSGNIANGATFSFTFSTAGTYSYHCSIHTFMKGTIVVQ
jgi:plastocyanin